MAEKKKSFVLYHDYLEHFEMLTNTEQGDLIMTILRYVNGEEPDMSKLSGGVRMAFSFIRRRLDDDFGKYEEICKKRAEASAKAVSSRREKAIITGGSELSSNVTGRYQTLSDRPDNDNDNVNVNDNDNVNVNDYENDYGNENENGNENGNAVVVNGEGASLSGETKQTTTTTGGAIIPTIEEITEYCNERKSSIDPYKFYDYYSTNGWKVGKNPMRDWKAAVRIWERREYGGTSASAPSYDIGEVNERTLAKYRNL